MKTHRSRTMLITGALASAVFLAGCAQQSSVDELRTQLKAAEDSARSANAKAESTREAAEKAAAAAEKAAARAEEAAKAASLAAEKADRAHRASLRK